MARFPARHAHYLFAIIQSGLTTAVASAIASTPFLADGSFVGHWLRAWVVAWLVMLPVVIFAAPLIRAVVGRLTDGTDRL